MTLWEPEAAHAAVNDCSFTCRVFVLLRLAAEEVARRNGHKSVTESDWNHAIREVRDGLSDN